MSEALINSQTQREWAYRALTAEARMEELEAKLAKAVEIAELFSGGVEYDYHGNIIGDEERKAMAELAELKGTE